MLKFDGITKAYENNAVLRGITMIVETGEIAALVGASGCGKTTLLRIAAGLEKADNGTVFADGKIAVLFPEPRLFSSLTAKQNVSCVMNGRRAENEAYATSLLASLGLNEAMNLRPDELSSGMAARVSLARALAYNADIYLLDEPFARLDKESKNAVMAVTADSLRGKTVLVVTHSADELALASKIYRMQDGIVRAG